MSRPLRFYISLLIFEVSLLMAMFNGIFPRITIIAVNDGWTGLWSFITIVSGMIFFKIEN